MAIIQILDYKPSIPPITKVTVGKNDTIILNKVTTKIYK